MKTISKHPVKRIPQRTCVACRKIRAKQELIRLVRISSDSIEVDASGKKAGRGAYLCPIGECWETGLKKGRLEYSLNTTLTQDSREQLIQFGRDLFKK